MEEHYYGFKIFCSEAATLKIQSVRGNEWERILSQAQLYHKNATTICREEEPKYIVRTLISNLRVGANWRSVIPGLARAFVLHEKGKNASKADMDAASAKVSEAFHLCPNLGVLIPALREGGLEELERRCTLKAGPCPRLSTPHIMRDPYILHPSHFMCQHRTSFLVLKPASNSQKCCCLSVLC